MPTLIRRAEGRFFTVEDTFVRLADDAAAPAHGGVIVSLSRFQADGEALLGQGRPVGVVVAPGEDVEVLAYDLPRLGLVALEFGKFRDGRPYSAARILREQLGFTGEVRAVGDVLLEQAAFMVRCGFDAFVPADGTSAEDWQAAAGRFRHVYQRAADDRLPAFAERVSG
jgi:uncharacterized protein (DUF934 family)